MSDFNVTVSGAKFTHVDVESRHLIGCRFVIIIFFIEGQGCLMNVMFLQLLVYV